MKKPRKLSEKSKFSLPLNLEFSLLSCFTQLVFLYSVVANTSPQIWYAEVAGGDFFQSKPEWSREAVFM